MIKTGSYSSPATPQFGTTVNSISLKAIDSPDPAGFPNANSIQSGSYITGSKSVGILLKCMLNFVIFGFVVGQ